MATIPSSPGNILGSNASFSHELKSATKHVENVKHVDCKATAGQTTSGGGPHSLTNIETVAYVVEKVKADFSLVPVILDEIRPDEVLVEMKYSGICRSSSTVHP